MPDSRFLALSVPGVPYLIKNSPRVAVSARPTAYRPVGAGGPGERGHTFEPT
jgi:hypothetical protein